MTAEGGVLKKQRCVGRFCTEQSEIGSLINGGEPSESSQRPITLRLSSSVSLLPTAPPVTGGFNDSVTADVILSLIPDQLFGSILESPNSADDSEIQVCLHSHALARSKYFSTLLSDRSGSGKSSNIQRLKLHVPGTAESLNLHLTVLKLLYADDLLSSIQSVKTALCLLPVALGLLFEDCIKACVKFLEAVPWTEEEEKQVLSLIPRMSHDQSKELLERISPGKNNSSEEMLHGLVFSAMNKYPNMCFAKAFLAKLLKDFPCKESARRVLHNAFEKSLKVVKQSLEEYSSPHFRGDHNETEALQRMNLHTAVTNGKRLLWLIERMIELKVADTAVKLWSEQSSFTADLQRAFRDDDFRHIVPSLPAVILRCTSKLINAVACGDIVADKQVRVRLVKEWLPVLIICRDGVSLMGEPNHTTLYLELEETFLSIISTLPLSTAQELLVQCLSFSTRSADDCPHLVCAFSTWFRRANRIPSITQVP